MVVIVVSIGRNVGPDPLPDESWNQFRQSVAGALAANDIEIRFSGTGSGSYGEMVEESHTFIGELSPADVRSGRVRPTTRADLLHILGILGFRYGQECVAVTFGSPTFV